MGKPGTDTAYFITSLGREQADAATLLALIRAHWRVETHFHIRDTSFREDECRCRVASVARLMAGLRSVSAAALRRLKLLPVDTIPRCRRRLAANPAPAYDLISRSLSEN